MKEKTAVLRTERLVLKALEERDREAFLRMAGDEEIRKTYMLPDFASREEADGFFDRMRILSCSGARFVYGVYLGDEVIGFLNDCGIKDGTAEVGYFISPAHWGRGYAAEALEAAIAELFRMGCGRVVAGYFEENPASGRVMEKCGMRSADRVSEIEYRGRKHRCLYRMICRETKREEHAHEKTDL